MPFTMRGAFLLSTVFVGCLSQSPWDPSFTLQASAALSQLNLSQKISLVHGHSIFDVPYVGNVPATVLSNLTLPPLNLEDGPSGVADALSFVTAWPNAGTVLASWDRSLFLAFGAAMGAEQYAKGVNVALAPAVNLCRVPWAGRCFEFLGEDPALASAFAESTVNGLQQLPISACVKHAFLNSQETNRNSVSENAPQRVLQELYYPPFRAAVAAGVGFAMCAYNRVNKFYACENNETLLDLKSGMGFRGAVMSDWYATHSAAPAALSGLDMEMPGGFYFSGALEAAVLAGTVPLAHLDAMVLRILTPLFALGLVANPPVPSRNIFSNATSAAHNALALELAESSLVLLKNEGALLPLPITSPALLRYAVFGDEGTVSGHGSGGVTLPYLITPTQGLLAALRAHGAPASASATYYPTLNASAAAAAAAAADVALVVVATTSSEGADRSDLELPAAHNALVAAIAAAQPRTIVVVRAPGAVTLPWLPAVRAVVFEGMAGQESGNSLGRTLVGASNPSGRLTQSWPVSMQDTWLSATPGGAIDPSRWPGTDRGRGFPESDYAEGLLMGWAYYEAVPAARRPAFAFGQGLSYSDFVYSACGLSGSRLSAANASSFVTLTCTLSLGPGSPAGAEVVQVYAGAHAPPPSEGEPLRRLLDFSKVALAPGGGGSSRAVSFSIRAQQFARWAEGGGWQIPLGVFQLDVASSSVLPRASLFVTIVE